MAIKHKLRILAYCSATSGGIAEYAVYQARALQVAGAEVVCLTPPGHLHGRATGVKKLERLPGLIPEGGSGWRKKISMALRIVGSQYSLAWQVLRRRPDLVLLDTYMEYLAPFWVWPHWFLARVCGVRYAATLHDPVRNYIVGPPWWHRFSVRLAYRPLDFVLVHHALPEPSPVPVGVGVVQVPHGLFEVNGVFDRYAVRHEWGIPPDAKVFLAFGYVRDAKNLAYAVRALTQVPDAFLVVAGSLANAKEKPFSYYRERAAECGVPARCRFFDGFVPDAELGKYFAAADFVLLTYAASFHSQSGVLNVAACARKPILASAAPSPLIEAVTRFQLGIAVPPDSPEAVIAGMRQLLSAPPTPRWDEYEASASWSVNARKILEMVG